MCAHAYCYWLFDFPGIDIVETKIIVDTITRIRRAAGGDEGGQGRDGRTDVRRAGEEEDWKTKTRDREGWKRLSDEVVKKLQAAPHP